MNWAFIQARTGSSRLKGKIKLPIMGTPMLERVLQRVRRMDTIHNIAILTTTLPEDQWIKSTYYPAVIVYEGNPDPLTRYYDASVEFGLAPDDRVVRITGDCPLLDPKLSDFVVSQMEYHVEYSSNVGSWPDGLDTEVFSCAALKKVNLFTLERRLREHVIALNELQLLKETRYVRIPSLAHLKWSVDTEADLEFVRLVYQTLGAEFTWRDVVELTLSDICQLCREDIPFASHGLASIGGPASSVRYDLHAPLVSGGEGREECVAFSLRGRTGEVVIAST